MNKEEIKHFKSLLRQGILRHKNILLDDKFQQELLNIIKEYENIKWQQDQYIKLLHKLDNQKPYGLNCLLFTYDEIIEILVKQYHPLKYYLERWFGTYEDFKENEGLFFAEDGIEVEKGNYWLVNVKTDYACTLDNLDRLNRKVYELEGNSE